MINILIQEINNFWKPQWFILMHGNKRDHSEKEEHCQVSCFLSYCSIKKRFLMTKSVSHKLLRNRFKESIINNTLYLRNLIIVNILIQYAKFYSYVHNTLFMFEKMYIYLICWFPNVFRNILDLTIFWSNFIFLWFC